MVSEVPVRGRAGSGLVGDDFRSVRVGKGSSELLGADIRADSELLGADFRAARL